MASMDDLPVKTISFSGMVLPERWTKYLEIKGQLISLENDVLVKNRARQ